CLQDIQLPVTF
nr:immunoglobulin light chain junction region [Macaca mulatta]MOV74942.1 immunoglobulin light chain junction region [Macaca mulatta]MOV75402.1 immunoglobulin light chain junction region [Macaca mulatta]MOV75905.1 immunoglobulin light chain junction region [Macaca mulatta]